MNRGACATSGLGQLVRQSSVPVVPAPSQGRPQEGPSHWHTQYDLVMNELVSSYVPPAQQPMLQHQHQQALQQVQQQLQQLQLAQGQQQVQQPAAQHIPQQQHFQLQNLPTPSPLPFGIPVSGGAPAVFVQDDFAMVSDSLFGLLNDSQPPVASAGGYHDFLFLHQPSASACTEPQVEAKLLTVTKTPAEPHRRMGDGSLRCICDAEKKYHTTSQLDRHISGHYLAYKCSMCGDEFNRLDNAKRHIKERSGLCRKGVARKRRSLAGKNVKQPRTKPGKATVQAQDSEDDDDDDDENACNFGDHDGTGPKQY